MAPPDRQGFCTVTAPSSTWSDTPSSANGRIRRSTASPLSMAFREYARTLCSAQAPPTKPSMEPSLRTIATSPARTLVGRWARTTVAETNDSPWAASSCARRSVVAFLTGAAPGGPASRPTPARGCTAC